jgi:peptidoglycan/LPS O-acetylase OafA/YrhL
MLEGLYNKFRRITTNKIYLPEIDGIRFLSLSLVTLFHIRGYFLEKTPIKFADNVNDYHWLNTLFVNFDRSVPLFFAISGFILCVPFANHYFNNGKKPVIKEYYVRRLTRLEPPYFIVMICIFLAQLALKTGSFSHLFPSLLASLIYSHGFIYHATPFVTVVAWTLEVEVQFYVIAPFLFRLLALPAVARRLLLAGSIVFFVIMQYLYPPRFLSIYGSFEYFLAGVLVADLYVSGFAIEFFKKKWQAIVAAITLVGMFLLPRWEEATGPHLLPLAVLFPFMIALLYYIILRNEIVKRVFSWKFIPVIGGMCYTTYLIHYTVISFLGRFTLRLKFTDYYIPNMLLQFTLLCSAILLIASVFYLYVEKPFMSKKWVDKLLKKKKTEVESLTVGTEVQEGMNA